MYSDEEKKTLEKFKKTYGVQNEDQNEINKNQDLNKSFDQLPEVKTKIKKNLDPVSGTEHRVEEMNKVNQLDQNIQQQDHANVNNVANVMLNELKPKEQMENLLKKIGEQDLISFKNKCKKIAEDGGKIHTNTFAEFKEASMELDEYIRGIADAKKEYEADDYDKMVTAILRLYEAANGYISTHSSKNDRYVAAQDIVKSLVKIIGPNVNAQNNNIVIKNPSNEEIKRAKEAKKPLIDLYDNYIKFCKELAENPFETPEEKLNRKLSLFNSHRVYFDDYEKADHQNVPKEIKALFEERDRLQSELIFRVQASKTVFKMKNKDAKEEFEEKTEREKRNEELDKGVTPQQAAKIAEIDRWLLRNYNNGGMVGAFRSKVKKNRSEFIFNLLSLSKRERLFIYYMIESRSRTKPDDTGNDMLYSQERYIPSLKNFKNKMIASKLKFSKRFTGDYIYWDKLDQAMAQMGYTANQDILKENYLEHKPGTKTLSADYKAFKDKKDAPFKEVFKVTKDELKEYKSKRDYIKVLFDAAEELKLTKENNGTLDLSFLEDSNVKLGRKVASSAITAPLGIISTVDYIISLKKNFKDIDKPEVVSAIYDAIFSFAKSAQGVLKAVSDIGTAVKKLQGKVPEGWKMMGFLNKDFMDAVSPYIGVANLASKAVSAGLLTYRKAKSTSATKALADKFKHMHETGKDQTEEGKKEIEKDTALLELNSKVINYKTKKLAMSGVNAGLGVATSIFPVASLPLSAISAVYATVTTVIEAVMENNLAKWIFDKYYRIDEQYKKLVAKFKVQRPDEYKLKRKLREKVASQNNCTSVHSAITNVGNDYADYVLKKINDNTLDEAGKKPYIDLIKAYGLKIKKATKPNEKDQPTRSALSRKIIGK